MEEIDIAGVKVRVHVVEGLPEDQVLVYAPRADESDETPLHRRVALIKNVASEEQRG